MKEKNRLFEMMGKVNPDFILNEGIVEKGGVDYKALPPEEQELFDSIFEYDKNSFDLRGISAQGYDGNYLRNRNFRDWDSPEGKQFRQQIDIKIKEFNSRSMLHDMVITSIADWETDDDRSWDASYGFTFVPKK